MARRLIPVGEPKKCTACGEIFPNTTDYFYRKHKSDDIHLASKCINCMKIQHANWRKNNPEKARERAHRFHDNNLEKVREQTRKRVMKHYYKDIDKTHERQRKQRAKKHVAI